VSESVARLVLQSDLAELARVREFAEAELEQHDAPSRTRFVTHLVLEELVSNIVRHGYGPAEEGGIGVELRHAAGDWEVRVEDHARAFDPHDAPAAELAPSLQDRRPGGLGLHLVKQMARDLRYERDGERNVVAVVI